MSDIETVFVGRRAGVICAAWTIRPVLDSDPEKRTQDKDLTIEELPADHPEVVAFRERPVHSVPASVTPAQMRLALDALGMLDAVEALVDKMGKAARIKWEYGVTIPRNDPFVAAAAQELKWTGAQIDDLFRSAALH